MRTSNSSALRSSVSSALAVTVISLIAWSFDSYTAHLYQQANPSSASTQAATSDQDSRNG